MFFNKFTPYVSDIKRVSWALALSLFLAMDLMGQQAASSTRFGLVEGLRKPVFDPVSGFVVGWVEAERLKAATRSVGPLNLPKHGLEATVLELRLLKLELSPQAWGVWLQVFQELARGLASPEGALYLPERAPFYFRGAPQLGPAGIVFSGVNGGQGTASQKLVLTYNAAEHQLQTKSQD